jgi:hypothetical protein
MAAGSRSAFVAISDNGGGRPQQVSLAGTGNYFLPIGDEPAPSLATSGSFRNGLSEPLRCEGETLVVNLHGALILTAIALRVGMKISIHVPVTDRRPAAEVVYVDPDQPRHCGIKLEKPENIWGLSLPPDDWYEG